VFVRVQPGEGNYRYLGDLNDNGIADEDEFIIDPFDGDYILINVPTSELFPVINLKTSTRWRINFDKIFKRKSFWSTILKPVSTETLLRLEEYSKEEDFKNVLLLKSSALLNDSTTIRGSNIVQQDFFLFKNKPGFSFRFRYLQSNKLNQYNNGSEKGYFRERSIRFRFRMAKQITNQTDFINQTDNVVSDTDNNRTRLVTINRLVSDFSYRPIMNIEVGFKFTVGRSTDERYSQPTVLDNNSQLLRFTFSFATRGRLRLEAERSEVNDNGTENLIPYEMLRGNVIGMNYFWRLNLDYRIANNLQIAVNYTGRMLADSDIVHNMRAEARAFF